MSTEFYIDFNETKNYNRQPNSVLNLNKWAVSWWTYTKLFETAFRFGIYGTVYNEQNPILSQKTVHTFQVYKGNFSYAGCINDHKYDAIIEAYDVGDTSFLKKWDHHVMIYNSSKIDSEKIKWIYNGNEIKIKTIEKFKSPYPIVSSISALAKNMRVWFGACIDNPDSTDLGSIADLRFYDGHDNTAYGNNGFNLTFNPADINKTTDEFGVPISIPDPYGSSESVPPNYYADASGSGNHWILE